MKLRTKFFSLAIVLVSLGFSAFSLRMLRVLSIQRDGMGGKGKEHHGKLSCLSAGNMQ